MSTNACTRAANYPVPRTGLFVAGEPPGGARWTAPATLLSVPGTESGIDNLTSGVNASGQGWAVDTESGKDYALEFSKKGASS